MPEPPRLRSIGLRAGAFLTLLAVGLIAPGWASAAGCAHPHVTTTSDHAGASAQLDLLSDLGVVPRSDSDAPRVPAPCSGPGCSKGSDTPLTPTPPPVPTRVEPWGCVEPREPDPDLPSAPWAAQEPAPRPSRGGPSIFHPPR